MSQLRAARNAGQGRLRDVSPRSAPSRQPQGGARVNLTGPARGCRLERVVNGDRYIRVLVKQAEFRPILELDSSLLKHTSIYFNSEEANSRPPSWIDCHRVGGWKHDRGVLGSTNSSLRQPNPRCTTGRKSGKTGAPDTIRTCDLCLRSNLTCPSILFDGFRSNALYHCNH